MAVEIPVARESVRVIGPDSVMSSALPAGGPSKMSVSTTSASSRSTIRCAVVDPTKPPPTTVTFFLLMPLLVSDELLRCESFALSASLRYLLLSLASELPCRRHALHILNDGRRKRRRAYFRRARHEPLEIVRDALLLNRESDAVLGQRGHFLPPQELEHHRARKHHRTRIDHILVCVLRRGAVRRFENAESVADIRSRRHTESAHLRRACIGQIIAIQIGSRQHAVFIRPQQHLLKHRIRDAVVDHQFLLPLSLSVSRVNRVERLLHFAADRLLERVRGRLESWLDQRRILLHRERRILVQIVHNPALALGDRLRSELLARQVIAPVAERAL